MIVASVDAVFTLYTTEPITSPNPDDAHTKNIKITKNRRKFVNAGFNPIIQYEITRNRNG